MRDREKELAYNLVNKSTNVKPGDKVLINYSNIPESFLRALILEVFNAGALPFYKNVDKSILKDVVQNGCSELFALMAEFDTEQMKKMDAVILALGENNAYEMSYVNAAKMNDYNNIYYKIVHLTHRLQKKWVTLRYPTPAFAQFAGMSTTEFEDYFYKVCNLDYNKMCKAMQPLKVLMEKTDKVQIVAPNTDLKFSIKNMPAVPCCGEKNIPDGEIYTAPVKDSVNGKINFNVPAFISGVLHMNICFEFENGKIVNATSSNTKHLNEVLNTDEGARYLGEFAFGVNPYVTRAINDVLFDEKMCGSIHFAFGNSYDDAFNGNLSSLHVDLIQKQTVECGGGKIYFDNVLIRENGKFVLPELVALNEENLI